MTRPRAPNIAIAGATGAVGREILGLLAGRGVPAARIRCLASQRSAGTKLAYAGSALAVEDLAADAFDGIDLAFFSCGRERSLRFAPLAADRGAIVIDNSSAFRLDPAVPLVVPEVNAAALAVGMGRRGGRIIANPNCSTIILVVALAPLAAAFGLERIVVSTYQAASGAGQAGLDALDAELRGRASGRTDDAAAREVFGHPLAFNVVPQIDTFADDGSTGEERKMLLETRKILDLPALAVDVTCVRVPVLRCHSESVSVATRQPVDVAAARRVLAAAPGLEVVDDPGARLYPMPIRAEGIEPVLCGRLRPSLAFEHGLQFWLCGDQLLKGAALNAVQIADALHRIMPANGEPEAEMRRS